MSKKVTYIKLVTCFILANITTINAGTIIETMESIKKNGWEAFQKENNLDLTSSQYDNTTLMENMESIKKSWEAFQKENNLDLEGPLTSSGYYNTWCLGPERDAINSRCTRSDGIGSIVAELGNPVAEAIGGFLSGIFEDVEDPYQTIEELQGVISELQGTIEELGNIAFGYS